MLAKCLYVRISEIFSGNRFACPSLRSFPKSFNKTLSPMDSGVGGITGACDGSIRRQMKMIKKV